MLKHGEANPLNIFSLRQLTHCPPHFEQVQFDLYTGSKDITDWIYENLEGRFYIGQINVTRSDSSKPTFIKTVVGFEHSSEATYFSMFLPQINANSWA